MFKNNVANSITLLCEYIELKFEGHHDLKSILATVTCKISNSFEGERFYSCWSDLQTFLMFAREIHQLLAESLTWSLKMYL